MPISIKKLKEMSKKKTVVDKILGLLKGSGQGWRPVELNKKFKTKHATAYLSKLYKKGLLKKITLPSEPGHGSWRTYYFYEPKK